MSRSLETALIAALLAVGCASAPTPQAAPTVPEPSSEVVRLPNDVHWARNSAEHRAVYLQIYGQATARLEELARAHETGTWAVALDADETVIDNSLYQKELTETGGSFTQESWGEWVERREAPPLPGAVPFLERIRELGGRIAIVTNRREALCPATEENFERYGIPYDVILCRPPESGDKQPRWDKIATGQASPDLPPLEILLWLGDNIHDFPGLDQAVRDGSDVAFAAFGETYFAFPNPMYGSWARNPPR